MSTGDAVPVLALHCLLASGAAWRPLAARLARPLVRVDLPGHGAAPDAAGDLMAQSVAHALAHAPEGPIDFVGHSFGACVALRIMADHPGRIRRAVLVEPVLFAAAPEPERGLGHDPDAVHAALARGDRAGALRSFHGDWGGGPLNAMPAASRAYMEARMPLFAATVPALLHDDGAVLARLPDRPVALVRGDCSPAVMKHILDGLAARMPRAETQVIEGAGHMIPFTHPEALGQVVERTLG
ncbi:alpha/beta fold hydrolase [Jannaschia sp. W003]|uniref:alpha/beta fold hydrolase n=1 Tax=Jannaschia sp. W003 TaxID=2867012 RepID=UPI0021A562BF|nr:alpha/beta hydrolase [Jannaschia sp. W003]UWQ20006.1 alpha/beta hydrolase [Jannaschia sp. W003]